MHLPMIDADLMVYANLICALCGVIAGILSASRSRFAITLGSLIIALLVLSLPIGFSNRRRSMIKFRWV